MVPVFQSLALAKVEHIGSAAIGEIRSRTRAAPTARRRTVRAAAIGLVDNPGDPLTLERRMAGNPQWPVYLVEGGMTMKMFWLGLASCLCLPGCSPGLVRAPNAPYRVVSPVADAACVAVIGSDDCKSHAFHRIRSKNDGPDADKLPVIAYVEFDDQGALYDRSRSQEVFAKIREVAGHGKFTIVAFAHGWKHNAKYDDGNVQQFQKLLVGIDDNVNAKGKPSADGRRQIIGVYIGWRGLSDKLPLTEQTSFWGRKNTSSRIGNDGVIEVIAELSNLRNGNTAKKQSTSPERDKNDKKQAQQQNNLLVLVGHSFGGQILFLATKHLMLKELVDAQRKPGADNSAGIRSFKGEHETFRPSIADLVMIVNPAIETTRLETLQGRATLSPFRSGQPPVFAAFMSRGDNATKRAFPIGRWFSTLFKSYRTLQAPANEGDGAATISQKDLDITAIGHHPSSVTHTLNASENQADWAGAKDEADYRGACDKWDNYLKGKNDELDFSGVVLSRANRKGVDRFSPYMVVSVDPKLIKDHSSIWSPEFTQFVVRFVEAPFYKQSCPPGWKESEESYK